jgi:hypothetical protein
LHTFSSGGATPVLLRRLRDPETTSLAAGSFCRDLRDLLTERVDPAARRAEVRRLADAGPAGREVALREWIAAGRTEEERRLRALGRDEELNELAFQVDQVQVQAYDAVLAGAPVLARLLDSDDVNLQLSGSGLVAWLPEAGELFVPRLCALVNSSSSAHVRATAAVAAGLLAADDDPVVVGALKALWQRGDRVEHWSACLGLAEMLSRPDDALIAELYDCFWTGSQRQPYWGFLSGQLDAFAALTIAALPPAVASARIEVILDRLRRPDPEVAGGGADVPSLAHLLLDAAIGPVRSVNGMSFSQLRPEQRRALLALSRLPALTGDLLRLLRSFGLPAATAPEFQRWVTG